MSKVAVVAEIIGDGADHRPAVDALYDLAVSICGGSGLLDSEEYQAVAALAEALGYEDVERLKPI